MLYTCHQQGRILKFNFEWDPSKAKLNYRKHKLTFDHAAEIFLDPIAISIYDEEHSTHEDRWITIGKDRSNKFFVVVHTFHEEDADNITIRLISARGATKKEIEQYEG
jgi:uncharacterized DUF497 family protein